MKKYGIVVRIIAFLLCFFLCGSLLRFLLVDDTASYTRLMLHEMYHQEDNIDTLFLGSSHCYRTFVTDVTDRELGCNTFNGGSSSQYIDGSFAMLKEADKHYRLKRVYLELYFGVTLGPSFDERTDMTSTYILSDYMKLGYNKWQYLLNASSPQYYVNSFLPERRYWRNIFHINIVMSSFHKFTNDYRHYGYGRVNASAKRGDEEYRGKGYVANYNVARNGKYFYSGNYNPMDLSAISEDWTNTVKDIADYCHSRKIEIVLLSAPMPSFYLLGYENYDDYIEKVKEIASETGCDYFDFNLCKEEYFPNTTKYFKDVDHLNNAGAMKFSKLFCDFVNGKVTEEELFYPTYAEKTEQMESKIYGISYEDTEDERNAKIVATGDGLEYKVIFTETNALGEPIGKRRTRKFNADKAFSLPITEHGAIKIVARERESGSVEGEDLVEY